MGVTILIPLWMHAQMFVEGDPQGTLVTHHVGGFLGQGVSFMDFNGDDLDDLTFTQFEGELFAYINNGQGGFTPHDLGLGEVLEQPKSALWVDLDNDGDKDLLVTQRLAPNVLFARMPDGTLQVVPNAGGLALGSGERTYGAAVADYDQDDLLDVYLCNFHSAPSNSEENALLRNLGGTDLSMVFEDVTLQSGTGNGVQQSFQATWVDLDRDGWLDLHVINDRMFWPDALFRNQGDGTFTEVGSLWGLDVSALSMSTSVADFDKDQDWDVVSSNGVESGSNHFRRCMGQPFGPFGTDQTSSLMYQEVALEAGILMDDLSWGVAWFDADNNGWLDLYIGTGTSMYTDYPAVIDLYPSSENGFFLNEGGTLPLTNASQAVNPFKELTFSVATADHNGDGALDLVSHQIGPRAHLLNGVPNGNHWIAVRPLADSGCPDAIGAELTCWKEGLGDVRTVHCGTEYMNQNSAWIHFGLGAEPSYDSLVVAWPSGATTTHVGLDVDQRHVLSEVLDDVVAETLGCTYPMACNFEEAAISDDGSCDMSCTCGLGTDWDSDLEMCVVDCIGDFTGDGAVGSQDLLLFLTVFGSVCD